MLLCNKILRLYYLGALFRFICLAIPWILSSCELCILLGFLLGIAPRWTLLIFADFVFSELVLSADKDDGGDESPEDELLAEYPLEWNSLVSRDWYLRGLCAGLTISEFKTPSGSCIWGFLGKGGGGWSSSAVVIFLFFGFPEDVVFFWGSAGALIL